MICKNSRTVEACTVAVPSFIMHLRHPQMLQGRTQAGVDNHARESIAHGAAVEFHDWDILNFSGVEILDQRAVPHLRLGRQLCPACLALLVNGDVMDLQPQICDCYRGKATQSIADQWVKAFAGYRELAGWADGHGAPAIKSSAAPSGVDGAPRESRSTAPCRVLRGHPNCSARLAATAESRVGITLRAGLVILQEDLSRSAIGEVRDARRVAQAVELELKHDAGAAIRETFAGSHGALRKNNGMSGMSPDPPWRHENRSAVRGAGPRGRAGRERILRVPR